jgi:hypothetical protein
MLCGIGAAFLYTNHVNSSIQRLRDFYVSLQNFGPWSHVFTHKTADTVIQTREHFFEVFAVVAVKNNAFFDVAPCSLIEVQTFRMSLLPSYTRIGSKRKTCKCRG